MKTRRPLLLSLTILAAVATGIFAGTHLSQGQPAPASQPAGKPRIPSQVIDVSKLATRDTGVGNRRDLFDAPTVTLNTLEGHISVLNVGQESHPPHQHANEEAIIMMEGQLEVYIQGKVTTAKKGDVLYFSSYDWHNVKNTGTVPAMYYVINWKTDATPNTRPAGTPTSAQARIPG